jgi:hypothetical protein
MPLWDDVTPTDTSDSRQASVARYEVTFTYVESEYARQRGIQETSYLGAFEVEASGPRAAVAAAELLFRQAEMQSGVSWPRTIKSASWRIIGTERGGGAEHE